MNPTRIEHINNNTIKMPIFYFADNNMENIVQALFVESIHGGSVNNMPTDIVLVRENSNGVKTSAVYTLKESTKQSISKNPIDN